MVRRKDLRASTSAAVATLMRPFRVLEQMLNATINVGTCATALRVAAIHRKSLSKSLRMLLDTLAESQQPLTILVTNCSRRQAYRQAFIAKAIALSALFMRSLKPTRWVPLGYHRALLLNGAVLQAFPPQGIGAWAFQLAGRLLQCCVSLTCVLQLVRKSVTRSKRPFIDLVFGQPSYSYSYRVFRVRVQNKAGVSKIWRCREN